MWRWSHQSHDNVNRIGIFSTYVEVILFAGSYMVLKAYFLHVCGGDPYVGEAVPAVDWFSPRMWRWSLLRVCKPVNKPIFSTYVEVILSSSGLNLKSGNFLHVCGGDPYSMINCCIRSLFSPRMWRWSWKRGIDQCCVRIFSTYVEVILISGAGGSATYDFLHVCGGDPDSWKSNEKKKGFSPRMWRWSYRVWSLIL